MKNIIPLFILIQTVICDICGTPTAIDPTSANELLAIGNDLENSGENQKTFNKRIPSQAVKKYSFKIKK